MSGSLLSSAQSNVVPERGVPVIKTFRFFRIGLTNDLLAQECRNSNAPSNAVPSARERDHLGRMSRHRAAGAAQPFIRIRECGPHARSNALVAVPEWFRGVESMFSRISVPPWLQQRVNAVQDFKELLPLAC